MKKPLSRAEIIQKLEELRRPVPKRLLRVVCAIIKEDRRRCPARAELREQRKRIRAQVQRYIDESDVCRVSDLYW